LEEIKTLHLQKAAFSFVEAAKAPIGNRSCEQAQERSYLLKLYRFRHEPPRPLQCYSPIRIVFGELELEGQLVAHRLKDRWTCQGPGHDGLKNDVRYRPHLECLDFEREFQSARWIFVADLKAPSQLKELRERDRAIRGGGFCLPKVAK